MFRKGLPASITNELGEILSYDGRVFYGDMKIYDTKYIFDDDEYLFDVDKSEVYTIGGNGIAVYNDKMYSSIYGIGIEDIKIDDMGNISMNGSNGKFTVYTTNERANGNLYKIGGEVNGTAYIGLNNAEMKVSVGTKNTQLSDITGSIIDNVNVAHDFSADKTTDLLLTLNENGVVAKNDNNESTLSSMPSESSQPMILPTGITEVPVQPTVTPNNTLEIPKASISPTSVGAKKVERTAIQSIRAYNKQLTVVVKKIKVVSGYHIQYGTDRKFSRNTKNRYSKTAYINLVGLKANKKYYVRARAYTIIKGKRYFGSWCVVRAKKIK